MQSNPLPVIMAMAAPPSGSQSGQPQNPIMAFLPMILLVVVFYFILIRPQQKRAKEQKKMLEALKSGDAVVTSAGIVGEVITVKERTVSLRSADSKLEVTKDSVVAITEPKA
jgi:preprotein translocase subunit YajC